MTESGLPELLFCGGGDVEGGLMILAACGVSTFCRTPARTTVIRVPNHTTGFFQKGPGLDASLLDGVGGVPVFGVPRGVVGGVVVVGLVDLPDRTDRL